MPLFFDDQRNSN